MGEMKIVGKKQGKLSEDRELSDTKHDIIVTNRGDMPAVIAK